jgi:hypothetical protein
MRFLTSYVVVVFAAFAVLSCATGAHADSFQLTYTGLNISGSLTLTATPNGNGTDTVTSITGSQTLNGVTQQVGLIAATAVPPNFTYYPSPDPSSPFLFGYDDLIFVNSSPVLDDGGLLLTLSGATLPVDLCGGPITDCVNPGEPYAEGVYVGGGSGNSSFNSNYNVYGISTLSLVQTPEPSTVLLLGFGIAAILLLSRSKAVGRTTLRN